MPKQLQVVFKGETLNVKFDSYCQKGCTAILLNDLDGMPYMHCTINKELYINHGLKLDDDEVLIKDYAENFGVVRALEDAMIIEYRYDIPISQHANAAVCTLLVNPEEYK